ncbi:MFS transporter [Pseudescherichia sp.]|uniref:MFS transporter n=1 Tax=Pseudescherichia sp. TaxID=2055881 RepID=UPI00289DAC34|nr:MFS transporter [Pseudescherichia sp.]
MKSKWHILLVIIFMYLPISLDATILYVVAPVLSTQLQASHNQLLWIMDIYPLVMAALLLPMGSLGDRIGYKKMAIAGSLLFGIASLAAACARSAEILIAARALLAVGAAMIVPATLAAVRKNFINEKDRNMALGIWTTIGTGGALAGPLVGGALLNYFYWGSVFLVNIPVVCVVLILIHRGLPDEKGGTNKPVNLSQGLLLMSTVLILIYAAKNFLHHDNSPLVSIYLLMVGLVLLGGFITIQIVSRSPLLDIGLLTQRNIIAGVILALTSMITLVGFELVISQELQFVHRFTPAQAGMYIMPLMLASCLAGPFAGYLINSFGIKNIAVAGLAASALSLYALSDIDFVDQSAKAWLWMMVLGAGDTVALMASSSAIMTAAPANKASSAGSIEGMSYELGTGLGITIFGSVLAGVYSSTVRLPENLSGTAYVSASTSFSEAVEVARHLDEASREALLKAASSAFMQSHTVMLQSASLILMVLMILTFFIFKQGNAVNHG